MSTAYRNHRPYAQAYSAPEANYGPRFDHYGPMPYQPHPVSAPPNGRASVKRAALAGRLAGAAVAAALFLGAPILATVTAAPAVAATDSDFDGLDDSAESRYGTLVHDSDSDEDRISDGDEAYKWFTNPMKQDTDGDGINDGTEVEWQLAGNRFCSPREADTDGDGVQDWDEIVAGTDCAVANSAPKQGPVPEPNPGPGQNERADRDGDGMFDDDEINGHNNAGAATDPDNPDTDGDGVNDGAEDDNGTNPNDPNDH